jgi:hypothetical protein
MTFRGRRSESRVERLAEIIRKSLALTERQFVNSAEREVVAHIRIGECAVEFEALIELSRNYTESARAIIDGRREGI